jgi:hypothetical protein
MLIAATLMIGGSQAANAALANGWNLFRINSCYASKAGAIPYIYVFDAAGDYILILAPEDLAAIALFCANGNAFWVNLTLPSTINAFDFIPGLH